MGLRVPEGKSIVTPRSACPNCHQTLSWKELIPVFSFLFQKGKCKNCGAAISKIYPIMELLTGLLFAFSFYHIGFHWELLATLTLISLLHIITVSDLAYMIIPDKVLLFFVFIFIIERIFIPISPWYDPILGAVVGFGLLFLIAVVSKGGMGGGDIKLFGVIGIVLGLTNTLLTFFFAALLGSVIGMIGLLAKKVKRKNPIPFGPFIAAGALLAYFYGHDLLNWYLSLIN